MAMMKVKNEAGEWVPIAPTNFMHQFKFVYITPTAVEGGGNKLDLSPYVQKNSDFMLIMKPDVSNNAGPFQVYIHSDGKARQFSNYNGMGGDINILDWPFPTSTSFTKFNYDEESRAMIYSANTDGRGFNKSLLIYAG